MFVAQYSCSNPTAYGALCAFAVILFLVQGTFAGAVYYWRGELINETGLYSEVPTSGIQQNTFNQYNNSVNQNYHSGNVQAPYFRQNGSSADI